jgi:hypothetical protein
MLGSYVRSRALALTSWLLAACASPVATVTVPSCPELKPTEAVASAPAPPPPEPLVLSAPWTALASVPLKPLVVDEVRSSSVRDWKTTDLGSAGEALAGVFLHEIVKPRPSNDIPSTVRGVLVATLPERADPTPYTFSGPAGQASPLWFVNGHGFQGAARFVSDGRGGSFVRVARETLEGRKLEIDSAYFTPGLANPWTLKRAVHLVDVEVNGGQGDATKDSQFVITNVRVLDRSEILPLDLDAVVAALSQRAASRLKELESEGEVRRRAAESSIDAAARRLPPKEWDGWSTEYAPQPWVSWDDTKRELSVLHVQRRPARYEAPARPLPVRCAPGQPCAQMMEVPRFQIDVLQAVRHTVSAAGVLREEITFEPQVRVTRLP